MFAVSARATRVPVAKTGSVPSARRTARKTAIVSAAEPSTDRSEPASTRTADRAESATSNPKAGVPRRAAMAAALGLAAQTSVMARPSPASAATRLFALASSETASGKTFEFKTYRLTAPSVYEEVNVPLRDPATGVVSPTVLLLKDTRAGQAGNTVSVSKQTVPPGGIASVKEIGTARETRSGSSPRRARGPRGRSGRRSGASEAASRSATPPSARTKTGCSTTPGVLEERAGRAAVVLTTRPPPTAIVHAHRGGGRGQVRERDGRRAQAVRAVVPGDPAERRGAGRAGAGEEGQGEEVTRRTGLFRCRAFRRVRLPNTKRNIRFFVAFTF